MSASSAPFKSTEARDAYVAAYDATLDASTVRVEESDLATSYGIAHIVMAGDPTKPALIALHGRCASSTMWIAHLPVLTRHHRVVMIDEPGDMNKSIPTRPLSRRRDVVAFVDSVLDALGIHRAAFIGMSYGAFASVLYAMDRPERVTLVALLSPAATFSSVSPRWMIRAIRAMSVRSSTRSIDSFIHSMVAPSSIPCLGETPNRQLFDQWRVGIPGFRLSWRDRPPTKCSARSLARMTMPTLVIYGDHDSVTNASKAAARANVVLPHALVELVTDANHCVDIDQPARVHHLLDDFFARAGAGSS